MTCVVVPQGKAFEVCACCYCLWLAWGVFTILLYVWRRYYFQAFSCSCVLQQFQTGVFKGDDTFSVDRLVASCQPRIMPALPSAGRVLVPYFESPEDCVNDTLGRAKVDPAR